MRYEDASQAGSITDGTELIARPDVETLPPNSNGPGMGNAISGAGTNSGAAGADSIANGPGTIVELQGAGGAATPSGSSLQAAGLYGSLTMGTDGTYNYVRTGGSPDGVQDVFQYTLADATGARSSTTLTVEIPRIIDQQAVVNLPAGVQMSDIKVVGRDLVIQMPDGTQMVIPGGAVFVPELSIGDIVVPPSNLAALLIDSEPQPAAGPPQSSGGNFADDVPDLDPGAPLGDLIPPTELDYTPPEYEDPQEIVDREPTIIIITPDNPAGAVNATASVDESGLPERGSEPEGTLEPQNIETTSGTIQFTAEDGLDTLTINDTVVTAVGQQIAGEHGVLTITSIDLENGTVGYTYTATDNTTDGVDDFEDFSVVVTDEDGDTATGTLHIDIADDEPIARDDVDVVNLQTNSATGNVMTGLGTNAGAASGDTVGADDATLTAVEGEGGSDSSFDSDGNLVVDGEFGTLTIDAEGNYTYVPFDDAQGGTEDVFTYTLTDGDGDEITATLTIINPDTTPTAGTNPLVQLDDDVLGGNAGGTGDDPNSVNATGTLSGEGGDGDLTFDLLTTGAPEGFTYVDGPNGSILVQQVQNGVTVTVLTITVDPATGEYAVVQNANILHDDAQNENNVVFTINYTVTDSDGDTVASTLTVNVDDDTPLAANDTDTLGENDTQATGNVITGAGTNQGTGNADKPGADGFDGITGLVGANSTDSNPSGGFEVEGEFGTLVMDADGNYTYTRDPDAIEGGNDVFTYTYVDGDGDTVSATLTIVVPNIDLVPELVAPDTVLMDDDAVSGADGNPGTPDVDDDPDPTPANSEGQFVGTGGNGDLDYYFSGVVGLPAGQGFTTNPVDASTLQILQNGTVVLTITLDNETGEWTVVQDAPILHPEGGLENNLTFTVGVYAQDADGSQSDPVNITINVDDDTPVVNEQGSIGGIVDEDDLDDGNDDDEAGDDDPTNALDGTVLIGAEGSLDALYEPGADQPLTYSLNPDTQSLEDQELTSGGLPISYVVVNGVVYAFTGDGDLNGDGEPTTGLVFTLAVDDDGSWTFTLLDQLDHDAPDEGDPAFENEIDIDFSGMIVAKDADGDPAPALAEGAFEVTVDDDLPVVAEEPTPVTGLVDEDDLSTEDGDLVDGNNDDENGDQDPDNADNDDNGTTTGGPAGSLSALFSIGADQPGRIVLIDDASSLEDQDLTSGGDPLSYDIDPETGILTAYVDEGDGELGDGDAVIFTLTVEEDGSWSFDLQGQLDHDAPDEGDPAFENEIDIDFSGVIGAVDEDGDPVAAPLGEGAFEVTVDDDIPTANQPGENEEPLLGGVVDEDDLPDGIGDTTSDGDDDPTDLANGTVVSGNAGSLDALFNPGADQPLTYTVNVDTSGLPELTSNDQPVVYHADPETGLLTAYVDEGDGEFGAGDTEVFTLQVNADGSWEFELLDQLDHDEDDTEDNLPLDLSSGIVAVDADGDPVPAAPGTFVIDVDDDMPIDFTPDDAIAENTGDDVVTGFLDSDDDIEDNIGADRPATLSFVLEENGDPLLNTDGGAIKVNGAPVLLYLQEDGSLLATTDVEDEDATVFIATLNAETGEYEITFYQQLDNGSTTASDLSAVEAGNTPWAGFDPDVDENGDPITITQSPDPNPDSTDLLFTGYKADGTLSTLNNDNDDIGVGTGQKLDPGEVLRVDMVQDLRYDPGDTESDAGGYLYDNHIAQKVFSFGMIQTQSHNEVDVLIKAFNVDDGDPTSQSDVNAVGINTQVDIDHTSIVVKLGNVTLVEGVDYFVYESGLGVYVQGIPEGATVTFQAVGGATFEAVTIENANGDQIPGEPAGTLFTGAEFALGNFSYGENDPGDPVSFELPVELTDADGDTSEGTIPVTVYPEGEVPTTTTTTTTISLMTQQSVEETSDISAAALIASNDNIETAQARAFNVAQQAAMMGVVAAAGLQASAQLAIKDATSGLDHAALGRHAADSVQTSSDLAAVSEGEVSASALLASTEEASVEASAKGSSTDADQPSNHLDSAANDDGAAALSALHQGTEAPAVEAAHATMTAAAVAMPSAEMMAALEAGESALAAPAGASVAQTQEVGRILADALQGGDGPDIGALLAAATGGAGAKAAALDALASVHGSGVPDGHNGNMAAFANGHGVLSMDALAFHHDAPPANV